MTWAIVIAFAVTVGWPNVWILLSTRRRIHTELRAVTAGDWVLVLGCAPKLLSGGDNSYFVTRMTATAELVSAGKARRVLASGGPLRSPMQELGAYVDSEAECMQARLIELGLQAKDITIDREGVRTLRSIEYARSHLQSQKLIIVSQGFHTPRAVYLARRLGLDAVAFSAPSPRLGLKRLVRVELREVLARTRAYWEK